MPDRLFWNPCTLVLPVGAGLVRLYQVHSRRNILATLSILNLADTATGGATVHELEAAFRAASSPIRMVDATTFTLWDSAYNNADFFDIEITSDQLEPINFQDCLTMLIEMQMVAETWPPQIDWRKRSFGDRFRGTFNEQVGTEALFQRKQPAAWWTEQKFEPDLSQTRASPYRFVQDAFLEEYFKALEGKAVLELGSGTGYYSRKIAKSAERVLGIDSNADYVEIARNLSPAHAFPNLSFALGDITNLDSHAAGDTWGKFDCIVLIDTLLFLFDETYQPDLASRREIIMRAMGELLSPGGRICVLDPHPFWLTARFGGATAPFGILTEYRSRRFHEIPSLEEISDLFYAADLRIRRILEPSCEATYREIDPDAYAFIQEFPQWWFFELEKAREPTVK